MDIEHRFFLSMGYAALADNLLFTVMMGLTCQKYVVLYGVALVDVVRVTCKREDIITLTRRRRGSPLARWRVISRKSPRVLDSRLATSG